MRKRMNEFYRFDEDPELLAVQNLNFASVSENALINQTSARDYFYKCQPANQFFVNQTTSLYGSPVIQAISWNFLKLRTS